MSIVSIFGFCPIALMRRSLLLFAKLHVNPLMNRKTVNPWYISAKIGEEKKTIFTESSAM